MNLWRRFAPEWTGGNLQLCVYTNANPAVLKVQRHHGRLPCNLSEEVHEPLTCQVGIKTGCISLLL